MIDATIHRLRSALRDADGAAIADLAGTLHAVDWANLAHHLDDDELQQLMQHLPDATASAVLAELSPPGAARVLPGLPHSRAVSLLEQLSPDDATDVLQELPDASASDLLTGMNPEDAGAIRLLLNWPEDSAGALMTPEFVAIQPEIRADQAIRALRELAAEAELANYVYVLDQDDVLLGVLSLRNLLLAPADAQVRQLMITPVLSVEAGSDQRVAVNLLRDRGLLALPVTDEQHRLLGVITHDDAAEVFEAELVDDYMKLAGTDAEEMERRSPWQIARLRVPWLLGTMVIELGAGLVIHRFDDVLQRVILLAAFMPVISAVSVNVGLQ
jgi:magnesium transporter